MSNKSISLPRPEMDGPLSVERAILQRRSVRSFSKRAIDDHKLGQILWAAQGLRGDSNYRTAPSAGALYPLELFTITESAISKYLPDEHALTVIQPGDFRPSLAHAALDQEFILQAPVTLIFTAVPERTIARYGRERSPRYIHLEVGHAAQNAMLQATALELGSVAVGAFYDERVAELLALTEAMIPLYLVPIGYPA